jgi:hypothetical protein
VLLAAPARGWVPALKELGMVCSAAGTPEMPPPGGQYREGYRAAMAARFPGDPDWAAVDPPPAAPPAPGPFPRSGAPPAPGPFWEPGEGVRSRVPPQPAPTGEFAPFSFGPVSPAPRCAAAGAAQLVRASDRA